MNKKRVNELLLKAKEALVECEICDKSGKIDHAFRGQISTFGASVVMGSLPAAVAFFCEQGGASVERNKLMQAIYFCLYGEKITPREVLQFVCDHNSYDLKEKITDAAVAIKLAMNFFELVKKGVTDEKSESAV